MPFFEKKITNVSPVDNIPQVLRQYLYMYNGCSQCPQIAEPLYGVIPSSAHWLHTYESQWSNNTDAQNLNIAYIWYPQQGPLFLNFFIWYYGIDDILYLPVSSGIYLHSLSLSSTGKDNYIPQYPMAFTGLCFCIMKNIAASTKKPIL